MGKIGSCGTVPAKPEDLSSNPSATKKEREKLAKKTLDGDVRRESLLHWGT
jgi:hypothetical protein